MKSWAAVDLPLSLLVLLASWATRADWSYPKGLGSLRANQESVEQALRRFGRAAGVSSEAEDAGTETHAEKPKSLFQVHDEVSLSRLPQGKLLFGRLVNRLVVGPDGSPALVDLNSGQGWVSGLRAMGMARQAGVEGRVSVELKRLLLRSGQAVALQATVLDPDGAYGLQAETVSGKLWAVAGAMAGSFIAGGASALQTQAPSPFGFSQTQPTGRNALLQGMAQTAADQSKRLIDDATSEKPVLIVEAGAEVTVLVQEELRR